MVDFEDLVKNKLQEDGKGEVAALWNDIYKSYEEGGPDSVEELVLSMLNELKRGVNKEVKSMKTVIPKKRKKGRR